MSKSLGNSPDALELIKNYGADGVRMGLMLAAPAGNDILYDDALCEQGRNFNNKIWNAFRLVKGWNVDETLPQPQTAAIAVEWFDAQLNRTLEEVKDLFGKYRLSEALMAIYSGTSMHCSVCCILSCPSSPKNCGNTCMTAKKAKAS